MKTLIFFAFMLASLSSFAQVPVPKALSGNIVEQAMNHELTCYVHETKYYYQLYLDKKFSGNYDYSQVESMLQDLVLSKKCVRRNLKHIPDIIERATNGELEGCVLESISGVNTLYVNGVKEAPVYTQDEFLAHHLGELREQGLCLLQEESVLP